MEVTPQTERLSSASLVTFVTHGSLVFSVTVPAVLVVVTLTTHCLHNKNLLGRIEERLSNQSVSTISIRKVEANFGGDWRTFSFFLPFFLKQF